MSVRALLGLLVLVGVAVFVARAGAGTNPPPSFNTGFLPVVYNATNGAVRVVPPWGVVGAFIPDCTPPAAWVVPGASYDPTLCNTGGSFAAKNNEFYTEMFSAGLMATGTGAMAPYLAIAYNSSNGAARIVPEWNIAAGSDPTCTPPSDWVVTGVNYDSSVCATGGSFAAKQNEFYWELGNALPAGVGPTSVGLSPVLTVENPPSTYNAGFIPIAYDASSGKMRFLRPWGVVGAFIPDCTPPAAWVVPGASYDPTLCNNGGVFDALTSETYTEFFPAS